MYMYMYLFLGKCPVARISAHPPIFTVELQAPMGACPGEYGISLAFVGKYNELYDHSRAV